MRTIVLNTNCLLAILPSKSPFHNVWVDLLSGKICLCISNEIISEYEEILKRKIPEDVAVNAIQTILNLPELHQVNPSYFFHLIESDPDDNKFVDCAICGGAELIVTNDSHFDVLRDIDFPKVSVKSLAEFSEALLLP